MIFPQPPWNLFGVLHESEMETLLAKLKDSGLEYQIKHEPKDAKPYCLWIHDDDLQRAVDLLFKKSK